VKPVIRDDKSQLTADVPLEKVRVVKND